MLEDKKDEEATSKSEEVDDSGDKESDNKSLGYLIPEIKVNFSFPESVPSLDHAAHLRFSVSFAPLVETKDPLAPPLLELQDVEALIEEVPEVE